MPGPIVILALILLLAGNLWLFKQWRTASRARRNEHSFWVVSHRESPPQERYDAFLELVAAGNKEWRSAYLSELDLSGVYLPNADLQWTDFRATKMSKATLVGASLSKGRLQQADLSGADLTRANLSGADFYRALLSHTRLRQANLRGAALQEAEVIGADLWAADLSDSYLLMAKFNQANLSGANLSGANLEAVLFKQANLNLALLNGANLKDADFTDSNWWRARGLTESEISLLKKRFAPGPRSDAALRTDYQSWLKMSPALPSSPH
jgi:uncharacterized protein YjbI with pentapeptide repeats